MTASVHPIYDPGSRMHIATINAPYAAIRITVHVDRFEDPVVLRELFLYHFDVDSNAIEFAFGEKLQQDNENSFVKYETDPAIHVPPFRIQIAHQPATADISNYKFTIGWELLY
jgi:hypothetical protein